jgi:hypothetical protein
MQDSICERPQTGIVKSSGRQQIVGEEIGQRRGGLRGFRDNLFFVLRWSKPSQARFFHPDARLADTE